MNDSAVCCSMLDRRCDATHNVNMRHEEIRSRSQINSKTFIFYFRLFTAHLLLRSTVDSPVASEFGFSKSRTLFQKLLTGVHCSLFTVLSQLNLFATTSPTCSTVTVKGVLEFNTPLKKGALTFFERYDSIIIFYTAIALQRHACRPSLFGDSMATYIRLITAQCLSVQPKRRSQVEVITYHRCARNEILDREVDGI